MRLVGQLSRRLREDRFLQRVTVLSGGTLVGHAVLLLTAPLLTRLYTPEEFGLFSVFTALAGILGNSVAWCYELAVPIRSDDDEAAGMVIIAMLAASVTSAALALAVAWLGPWLAAVAGMPALLGVYWLLPLTTLLWGAGLTLDYWLIRQGLFRLAAINKVIRFATQAAVQLGLGLIGVGGQGLVIGLTLSYLVGLANCMRILPAADRARLRAACRRSPWPLAAGHWRYPAYSMPAVLLQNAAQCLPAILVATLYGPTAAGWFTLAQRLLDAPVLLLASSASAAYLGEARGLEADALRRLFVRTAGQFAVFGLVTMAPLLAFGPPLFAVVFGETWRAAGAVVQCLVPLQLLRFIVVPISQTLNVLQRQDLHLVAAALNLVTSGLAFAIGHWLALSALTTLLLFSLGSAATYLVYMGLTWRVLIRHGRA